MYLHSASKHTRMKVFVGTFHLQKEVTDSSGIQGKKEFEQITPEEETQI